MKNDVYSYNAEDKQYFLKQYNKRICTPVI